MAIFSKTTEKKKEARKKVSATPAKLTVKESELAARFLARPRVTEKSYTLNALNQYVFVVTKAATKKIVKRAVEEAYGVNVEKVRMVRLPAKKRSTGGRTGVKSAIKKALVSLTKGQSLEIFKGKV